MVVILFCKKKYLPAFCTELDIPFFLDLTGLFPFKHLLMAIEREKDTEVTDVEL